MSRPQGGRQPASTQGWYPQEAYYAPGWQPPSPPRSRRGLWITLGAVGLVVVLGLLGVAGALVARAVATRPLGEVETARGAHARQLEPGHCLVVLPEDGTVDRVSVGPCDRGHRAEVVGVTTLPDGPWPGQEEVVDRVVASCEMDNAQLEAGFVPVVWTPSEQSWAQGDRRGLCLAAAPGVARGSWTAGDEVTVQDT